MKTYAAILFLFINLAGFCQTKIDTLVFEKINNYRASKHLHKLVWNDTCTIAAKAHVSFLNSVSQLSHSKRDPGVGEVICDMSGVFDNSDSAESKFADRIVDAWKSSKKHNAIILNKKIKSMGVSSQISKNKTGFVNKSQLKGKTVVICK